MCMHRDRRIYLWLESGQQSTGLGQAAEYRQPERTCGIREFKTIQSQLLNILDSEEKSPMSVKSGILL